jgi:hypothetical protein
MLKHSHNQRIIVGSGCCNLLQFLPIFVPNLINIQFLFTNHSHKCIFLFMHACCCFTLETNSLNFCTKQTKTKNKTNCDETWRINLNDIQISNSNTNVKETMLANFLASLSPSYFQFGGSYPSSNPGFTLFVVLLEEKVSFFIFIFHFNKLLNKILQIIIPHIIVFVVILKFVTRSFYLFFHFIFIATTRKNNILHVEVGYSS